MTDREFFLYAVEDELPRFERLFTALPKDKLDWRPHPKNKSAGELVSYMAVECATFEVFLKTGAVDFGTLGPETAPKTFDTAVAAFTEGLIDAKQIVSGMAESDWDSTAKMMNGGKVDWETTKGKMAWSLLLDFIHHRGQLSVYIRPMGGKVPSIYGPSGDSQG